MREIFLYNPNLGYDFINDSLNEKERLIKCFNVFRFNSQMF